MFNIILFGPPGAGKGTQSEKLIDKYKLVHISTGDIFRAHIQQQTALGLKVSSLIANGELVPDSITINMLEEEIKKTPDAAGFIFDGFPRTVAQAEALDELLKSKNEPIAGMIALEVGDEELEHRLLLRGKDSGRADDANPEVIRKRIKEYNDKTAPVADFYKNQNKFYRVNGIGSKEDIFGSVNAIIEKL